MKSILDALPQTAQHSIDVEIFGLTDVVLITNIIAAANRGVLVRVMNDHTQESGPADKHAVQLLVDAGSVNGNITVKVGASEHGAIDHLKNLIIDGVDGAMADTSGVFYGSYNFSDSAQKQDNLAVFTNDPGEVQQALDKFNHDWQFNHCKPEWQPTPTHPPITTSTPPPTPDAQAATLQAAVTQVADAKE